MSAWSEPSSEQRGWPRKATPFNPVLRLTGGLSAAYEATRGSRFRPAAAQPQLETSARGRLVLSPTMPMIARRSELSVREYGELGKELVGIASQYSNDYILNIGEKIIAAALMFDMFTIDKYVDEIETIMSNK